MGAKYEWTYQGPDAKVRLPDNSLIDVKDGDTITWTDQRPPFVVAGEDIGGYHYSIMPKREPSGWEKWRRDMQRVRVVLNDDSVFIPHWWDNPIAATPQDGLKPISDVVREILDRTQQNMAPAPPAPSAAPKRELNEDDKALHRALKFGQPQIMEGSGRYDNARYAPEDED